VMKERVLVVAGFDPSGGAGLLMDTKVLTLLGFRVCAIPTALTFQNSKVFESWVPIEEKAFEKMLKLTLEDEIPEGVKIGMLATPKLIKILAKSLKEYRPKLKWVVLDPVLKASLRKDLFKGKDFVDVLKKELLPIVDVLTPNLEEAEALTDVKITSLMEIKETLGTFKAWKINYPLITGVDEADKKVTFYLDEDGKVRRVSVKKLPFEFHGTGCAFSSALLAFLLKEKNLNLAVKKALFWVYRRLLKVKKEFSEEVFTKRLKIFL